MAQECATHLFGSLYNFSITARDEIIESFGAVAAPNVSCEFRDGYYTICCLKSDDTSLFRFINIVREFIEVECEKEPEMFEDVKVTRKKGTISEPTPDMDDLAELATQPLRLTNGHLTNGHSSRPENEGLLIEHETVKRTWTPDQSGREIGSKISDYVIQKIGSLCSCRIDWTNEAVPDIEVKGDNEGDVGRAISKLGVMDKVAINQMSFPRVFSFPIVEGEPSFLLEMRALKDIGDRRCQTTLLPLDSPFFKTIQNALVVSMIRNGCRILIQQKRIKGPSNGAISPWKDHPFRSFGVDQGQELTPVTAPNAALRDALATSTTEWVAKTATAAEFVHPFQPDSVAEGQSDLSAEPKATTTVTYKEPPEPTLIQKPSTKRTRVAKGRGKPALAKAGTVGANVFNDPTQATIPKSPSSTRDPREGTDDSNKTFDQLWQQTPLGKENQAIAVQDQSEVVLSQEALPDVKPPFMPPVTLAAFEPAHQVASGDEDQSSIVVRELPEIMPSHQAASDQENEAQAVHELSEFVPNRTALADTKPLTIPLETPAAPEPSLQTASGKENQSMAARDLSELELQAALPEIKPPYMPPSPPPAPKPTVFGWEGRPVVRGRAGALIDTTAPQEHRDFGKPKPQNLKRTMGQKAPSRGLAGGNTAQIKKYEEASRQLLALALPRQGPVTFEFGIGRLLINHQTGSKEFKAKPFSLSEWLSAFPVKTDTDTDRLETTFTPRITTSLLDVESVVDTRLSQGRKLFNPEPILGNVTYVYKCTTKQGDQITINVNEDGTYKILGPEILVGSLDFHFPKRVWDASLRLTTSGLYTSRNQQQVDAVIENLKIFVSKDGTALDLSTQTSDQELVIKSITLRRQITYSSKVYADLLLQLCEVQDLNISQNENQYQGSIKEPKEMIDASRIWWEASIASVSAAEILADNDILELGEVAKWSPHTIIDKGVVRDMYSLAYETVTNIDNVGFLSKSVRDSSGSRGQTTSYQTSHQTSSKPTEGGSYW